MNQAAGSKRLDTLQLVHFPVRSIEQLVAKVVLGRLAWTSRVDYKNNWLALRKILRRVEGQIAPHSRRSHGGGAILRRHLHAPEPLSPRRRGTLPQDSDSCAASPAYERLRHASLSKVAALPRILEMAEFLVGQLREARAVTSRPLASTHQRPPSEQKQLFILVRRQRIYDGLDYAAIS